MQDIADVNETTSIVLIQMPHQDVFKLIMVIELSGVQFWSEIKLAITNRTPATRSCDFVIACLISDQIAFH